MQHIFIFQRLSPQNAFKPVLASDLIYERFMFLMVCVACDTRLLQSHWKCKIEKCLRTASRTQSSTHPFLIRRSGKKNSPFFLQECAFWTNVSLRGGWGLILFNILWNLYVLTVISVFFFPKIFFVLDFKIRCLICDFTKHCRILVGDIIYFLSGKFS